MTHSQPSPQVGDDIPYERFLDCVHCGLCTSACPTYLETGNENDSPRGRIYLMRAVVDGRLELTESVERHLELCLDCRSCETACPSGVQYGRLIEPFRVGLQQREQKADKGFDWFKQWILYGLFPYPGRMRWALAPMRMMQRIGLLSLVERWGLDRIMPAKLRRMQRLLPKLSPAGNRLPDVLPAKGTRRARVGLFLGCVAEAVFPETNRATARVLQENGCEVVIPRTQACCGAIHYHSGSGDPALELARKNLEAFPRDLDAIIVNAAGCGSMIRDLGHIGVELQPNATDENKALAEFSGRCRDVSEFLSELGLIAPQGSMPKVATYHDACHLVHAQSVREQPRNLLSLVPDLRVVPLVESDICCGAAGSYNLTEPEMADRLAARKVEHIVATNADMVVTGNVGCALQISAALRQAGHAIPVRHPMDVLDESYRGRAAN